MAAVAHSPLQTTPINHLNSGSACCPTHAKDGRRPQCSARLEGRKEGSSWIISLAPQTTVALVGKARGTAAGIHSIPNRRSFM